MKKNVLIIGGAGFVGNHLIHHIQNHLEWNIFATKMENEDIAINGSEVHNLNILNFDEVVQLFKELKPDYIFHLAAQSSVAVSWKNPNLTVDVNIKGTINVLDALKESDCRARILLIGSGEEYGFIRPKDIPINEEVLLQPGNIYAATKACQNMIGKIYSQAYGMDVISVRAFNHIGPNQLPQFVVADFCKQVAEIEKGLQESVIRVGNLSAKRDFTDVRDVVRAYCMLIEKGKSGETYNVGSGKAVEINEILRKILALSKVKIEVQIDPKKFRPVDVPIIEADISKIHSCCEWKPEVSIDRTLSETLNYWRNRENEI